MTPTTSAKFSRPDGLPRDVTAVAMELVTEGFDVEPHSHRKAQLILAMRGRVTVETTNGLWMVPPHCALWIPGDEQHGVHCVGDVELYVLSVEPGLVETMPDECSTLVVKPLLRELIIATSRLPEFYDLAGPATPMIATLLNELSSAAVERLSLPLSADPCLRRITEALRADPANRITVAEWASRLATSERTLARLVVQETGMSFGRWRRQFQIMLALEWLAEGRTVQAVALDLGYESASAFIVMFKKVLGEPPATYVAGRRGSLHRSPLN